MIRPTTFLRSLRLNQHVGRDILLACETFQHTGSFKFRAAWHLASNIENDHLLTASSGNFGQALAMACREMQKRCTVVMPNTSAAVKVQAVREFGGCVDLIDVRKITREGRIAELAPQNPNAYVANGYNDELVIAGNSSLGIELAKLNGDIDLIIAPVGGGGLSAGILTGLREESAPTRLIGAEPLLANDAARSLRAGQLIRDPIESETIADAARSPSLGARSWEILKDGIEDIIEVPEAEIREAVRLLFYLANLKVEPTGALALAALLVDKKRFDGRRLCCVISGGNVDPAVFNSLIA